MSIEYTQPSQHYTEIYEALDTVAEDMASLSETEQSLLAEIDPDQMSDDEQKELRGIVQAEVAKDRSDIGSRRDYALKSMYGKTVSFEDITIAGLGYINRYETPEEREGAADRVRLYNSLIELARQRGSVDTLAEVTYLPNPEEIVEKIMSDQPVKRLHGRIDEKTGRVWYNLASPRTVEMTGPAGAGKVVQTYPVEQIWSDTDTREMTAVLKDGKSIVFSADSRKWRLNEEDRTLELYIPGNARSLGELTFASLERELGSKDEATSLAVLAAGGNVPHIFTKFEYPDHANPRPLSVPKAN